MRLKAVTASGIFAERPGKDRELKIQEMLRKTISRAHTELKDWNGTGGVEEVLVDREDLGYHLYSVLEDDTLVFSGHGPSHG